MKRVEDAQQSKMGQRSPNGTKQPESDETGRGCPKEQNGTKESKSDEMDQGSPKQHEYKPNDSTGLLELGRKKAYNRPKRGKVCNKLALG